MKTIIILCFTCFLMIFSLDATATKTESSPKKATIYWDASLSMNSKNLDKELSFLEAYFLKDKNTEVSLVVFSNEIDLQKEFLVANSNWEALKKTLKNIQYEGVALFDVLQKETSSDIVFIFTDGVSVLDQVNINKKTPTYIISSTPNASKDILILESTATGGSYIDFNELTLQKGLEIILNNYSKHMVITPKKRKKIVTKPIASIGNQIQGTIYDLDGVLVGATVKIKGKNTFALTNINGKFAIAAKKGETLWISYVGKQVEKICIENQEELVVFLANDKNSVLDEVVVKSKITKEDDFVETGYGKIDKKKLGYAVKVIKSEDFNKSAYTLSQAIQGKRLPMRKIGSINLKGNPLIIVDGFPLIKDRIVKEGDPGQAVKAIDLLDPNQVASVTILKGLAATNIYGSEGHAGVILIATKAFSSNKKINKPVNTALLKNNTYTENIERVRDASLYKLPYIQEYKNFKTFQEVYAHYLIEREKHFKNPLFFINTAEYIALWGNKKLATKVLTNVLEITKNDVSLLRLTAYKLEEHQDYLFAKKIYKKTQELRPRESQVYRDLAQIYIKTDAYEKALVIYKNIYNKKYKGVDFSGLQKIITNELKHLVTTKADEINTLGLSKNYKVSSEINTRIVVEWNDNDASFELQFVNPQKKFFKWTHTKSSDGLRLFNERKQGFQIEEFLLDHTAKGKWIINIENKRQNYKKPIALKYTIYKNYGKSTESKETKVLILNNLKGKQMLGKIII